MEFQSINSASGGSEIAPCHNTLPQPDCSAESNNGMREAKAPFTSIDGFLASVEKRAFVMARVSTGDPDAALDIVQDSMFRMVKNYTERPQEQWLPLFFRIVNNRITDHHRKRGFDRLFRWFGDKKDDEPSMTEAVDLLPTGNESPYSHVQTDQLGDALEEALKQLPDRQRQAFLHRQWQGMSVAETAQAMGVSEGSVKTHLWRATQALQSKMQEYRD